uniref:Uncharacterized protein n=1 Tax=Astatotilapia calliptera TaxID=8154 RepID=A0AAX7VXQ2_ASTCA
MDHKNNHNKFIVCQYLEVSRVHSQSEGVQLTEAQKTTGEIINFADSISNCSHHGCSVLLHRGRAGAQVLPVGELFWGQTVSNQGFCSTIFHTLKSAAMFEHESFKDYQR